MEDGHPIPADSPLPAQGRVPPLRTEKCGIDGPAQNADMGEFPCAQEACELPGRHQCGCGAVVEAAHAGEHERTQPGKAIVADEIVEARVESGAGRNVEPACRRHCAVAERSLGGHVDRIGPVGLPVPGQACLCRQPETQPRVARQ